MLRIKLLILFATVICVQLAFAQQPAAEGPKSKTIACLTSLACTMVPVVAGIVLLSDGIELGSDRTVAAGVGIGSLGLLCGPGAGHLYAKNEGSFVKGLIIRGTAGAVAVYGLSKIGILYNNDNSLRVLGFLLGGSTIVVSAIHDISTTGRSVQRYNEQHGFSQFNVQPCYFANSEAPGLLLSMWF
jgi:hypothetical protein